MKLSFSVISYSALWRQETLLQQELQSTREELSKKEQGLRSMIGKVSTISSKNICSQDHQTSSFFYFTASFSKGLCKQWLSCITFSELQDSDIISIKLKVKVIQSLIDFRRGDNLKYKDLQ